MDINTIGIGGLLGAFLIVSVNIYLHQKNIKQDRLKEQLKNLYNPLNAIIKKKKRYLDLMKNTDELNEKYMVEYYDFFLELLDFYLNNEVYASLSLRKKFHSLWDHHDIEFSNYSQNKNSYDKKEIHKNIALFELRHNIDGNGLSEFERLLESLIETVSDDISKIYKNEPLYFYYK